jgi:hypothetical protein
MENTYAARKVTQLDWVFGGSLLFVSLILTLNLALRSLWLVYAAIVVVLVVLDQITRKHPSEKRSLRELWMLAVSSVMLYPLVDHVFEARLGLVRYLTDDPKLWVTPIYVILYWVLGILLFGYVFHRVRHLTGKAWAGGLACGLFSAVSATLVETLFNLAGFYANSPSRFMIGPIPLYVPLGYLLTFSLMPVYLRWRYVFGFLLSALVGIGWLIFYGLLR